MSLFNDLMKERKTTSIESSIINFITTRPNEVIEMSMEEFANITYTSRSTISRFCKKYGYKGFNELRMQLAIEMNLYLKDSQTRVGTLPFDLNDNPFNIVNNYSAQAIYSITETMRANSADTLLAVAKKIVEANEIIFIGIEFSGIVAKDAFTHFNKIGKSCRYFVEGYEMVNYSKYARPTDLVFAFSYSGATKFCLETIKLVTQRNATVVSVTTNSKNKLADISNMNLYVNSIDDPTHNLSLSSRTSTLVLMDAIYCLVLSLMKDSITEVLAQNNELYGRVFELR